MRDRQWTFCTASLGIMSTDRSYKVDFTTDRFDLSGEIPESANAGNQIYGCDVAVFLSRSLTDQGLQSQYIDEDWGWLVFGQESAITSFEICIYPWGLLNDGEGESTQWRLRLSMSRKSSSLIGLLPKTEAIECTESFLAKVRHALSQSDIQIKLFQRAVSWN